MLVAESGSTVLLSDTEGAATLAAGLAGDDAHFSWHTSLEELLREQSLSSVSVLVLDLRPVPRGSMLAVVARMALEYPELQKVVVVEGPLPLPVLEYLISCGVDLVRSEGDDEELDRLVDAVRRVQARSLWATTPAS